MWHTVVLLLLFSTVSRSSSFSTPRTTLPFRRPAASWRLRHIQFSRCSARRSNDFRKPMWHDPSQISKHSLSNTLHNTPNLNATSEKQTSWGHSQSSPSISLSKPPRRQRNSTGTTPPRAFRDTRQSNRSHAKTPGTPTGGPGKGSRGPGGKMSVYNKHLFRTKLHVKLNKKHDYRRTILVGDVHGCFVELKDLLKRAKYDARKDRLILAGDLVGKGPHSKQVVEFMREVKGLAVRGNHDHRVVKASLGMVRTVKNEVKALVEHLGRENLQWLATLPLSIHLQEYNAYVVHAGVMPNTKVEHNSPELLMNLRGMMQDTKPTMKHGEGSPWAERWEGPDLVIFGHDASRRLQIHQYALGLDTGCVHGGNLTALILPHFKLLSVPSRKIYKRPKVPLSANQSRTGSSNVEAKRNVPPNTTLKLDDQQPVPQRNAKGKRPGSGAGGSSRDDSVTSSSDIDGVQPFPQGDSNLQRSRVNSTSDA